jgi:hypothetical protein
MNFFGHYTQQYVNRRSRRAYKNHRVLVWCYHYKQSYLRWVRSIRKLKLPSISFDDPVPKVVNYTFTYPKEVEANGDESKNVS